MCVAVLDLLKQVLAVGKFGNLISGSNYEAYTKRLDRLRSSDLSQVYRAFSLDCEVSQPVRNRNTCKLLWLLRAIEGQQSEFLEQHFDKIKFLSWRVREAEILCKYLKEARNAQAHDNNPRQHLGWLISIPSNILRLIEICPSNETMKPQLEHLKKTCLQQLNQALVPYYDTDLPVEDDSQDSGNVQLDANTVAAQTELSVLDAKLDSVISMISNLDLILEKKSVRNEATNLHEIDNQNDEDPINSNEDEHNNHSYTEIEYLTPNMVRLELLKLSRKTDRPVDNKILSSPNENCLQIAIIEEILTHKPKNVSEVLELPDVKWRYDRYSKSMDQQVEIFGSLIDDILQRAVWD